MNQIEDMLIEIWKIVEELDAKEWVGEGERLYTCNVAESRSVFFGLTKRYLRSLFYSESELPFPQLFTPARPDVLYRSGCLHGGRSVSGAVAMMQWRYEC
jgi:hypothetical protein